MTGEFRGKRLFGGRLFAGRLFGPPATSEPSGGVGRQLLRNRRRRRRDTDNDVLLFLLAK